MVHKGSDGSSPSPFQHKAVLAYVVGLFDNKPDECVLTDFHIY